MSPEFEPQILEPQAQAESYIEQVEQEGRLRAMAGKVIEFASNAADHVRGRALPYLATGAAALGGGVASAAQAEGAGPGIAVPNSRAALVVEGGATSLLATTSIDFNPNSIGATTSSIKYRHHSLRYLKRHCSISAPLNPSAGGPENEKKGLKAWAVTSQTDISRTFYWKVKKPKSIRFEGFYVRRYDGSVYAPKPTHFTSTTGEYLDNRVGRKGVSQFIPCATPKKKKA